MSTTDFSSLEPNRKRSLLEWQKRLEPQLVKEFIGNGVLVEVLDVEGFEGLFEFDSCPDLYRLTSYRDHVIAASVDGGRDIRVEKTGLVYLSRPDQLAKLIFDANGFEVISPVNGQSSMITVARRKIEDDYFACVLVLDQNLFKGFGVNDFLDRLAVDNKAVIVLSDQGATALPTVVTANQKVSFISIPTVNNQWKLKRSTFVGRKFGHSVETIALLYPEKKIIFDEQRRRILIFGQEITVNPKFRTFDFFRGICKIASPMSDEEFARQYLGYYDNEPEETVKTTKHQVREAIRKAFAHDDRLEEALHMCSPKGKPARHVKRAFSTDEIYFIAI